MLILFIKHDCFMNYTAIVVPEKCNIAVSTLYS